MVRSFSVRRAHIAIVLAALWGTFFLLAIAACSSDGSELGTVTDASRDSAREDATDSAAPLPYPLNQVCPPDREDGGVCATCVHEHCCASRARLLGTDAGYELGGCVESDASTGTPVACDLACLTACFDQAPGEVQPFFEHFACRRHHCASACDDPPGAPVTPCHACQQSKCLEDRLACNLSRDCFLVGTCIDECGNGASCVAACADRYPAGSRLQNLLFVCSVNLCANECAGK
jgi:hypothetical protein